MLLAVLGWIVAMLSARRLEWRRTVLDVPLALLTLVVLLQALLGSGPLARWALGPATEPFRDLPLPFLTLGTVSTAQTWRSLGLLLTYAAVYVLVVNLVREVSELSRLVRGLVLLGGVLAFLGLPGYLLGHRWLFIWEYSPKISRLAGPFVNPDHFASWLAMLAMLGIGLLASSRRGAGQSLRRVLTLRAAREDFSRRYLPAVAVGVMVLALTFTLSRGAVVSVAAAIVFVLALFGALGRARWTSVVVGGVLTVVLGYASWIGIQPLLARFAEGQSRWTQLVSSLPMLRDFPVLGVGLGAYKDIYFRYQPVTLGAGRMYFAYAHNDLLQLVIELGPLAAILAGGAAWRVGRDLVAAHLLGRGSCAVGGGEGRLAQRHDPFSTGIAIGALGAVVALAVHSAFDFSARIPANGMLGAACLGIATVALHTRFDRKGQLLTAVWARPLARRGVGVWTIAGAGAVVSCALALLIARPAVVDGLLDVRTGTATTRVDEGLRLDPGNPRLLALRAGERLRAARGIWSVGLDARAHPIPVERRGPDARRLAALAIHDLRAAVAAVPSDPFLHDQLARAHGWLAAVDAGAADDHERLAVTHFRRAIALAPRNPVLHASLAAFALTRPTTLIPVALDAARQALEHDPSRMPWFVARFDEIGLTGAQWLNVAPESWVARLELGSALEAQGRRHEAVVAYRDAAGRAPAHDTVALWLLARALTETRQGAAALAEADRALARDPGNPELQATRAQALAVVGDPAALDVFRGAAERADVLDLQPVAQALPFALHPAQGAPPADARTTGRVTALVVARVGQPMRPQRYHALLGRYLVDRRLWDQAATEWDLVLVRAPADAEAHFYRGMVWENLGGRDRAIEQYRRAVALEPRPAFRRALARVLWDTEQYFQAMNEWRAVLDREPQNVEALLRLAEAHLKEGDRLAAYRGFHAVLQVAPDNPVARRELARLTGGSR